MLTIPKYKESGIYGIINNTTGKSYIGKSKNLRKSIQNHISQLCSGTHIVKAIQNDFDRGDDFTVEILLPLGAYVPAYTDNVLTTFEYEFISSSSASELYNRYLNPPYVWNTICNIPKSIRELQLYQYGDIYNPAYRKYMVSYKSN